MKLNLARCFHFVVFCSLLIASAPLRSAPAAPDWNLAVLDQILAGVQPGQTFVTIDDMDIPVSNLTAWRNQLAGTPSPESAFDGVAATWPGGNVFYMFSNNVPA